MSTTRYKINNEYSYSAQNGSRFKTFIYFTKQFKKKTAIINIPIYINKLIPSISSILIYFTSQFLSSAFLISSAVNIS